MAKQPESTVPFPCDDNDLDEPVVEDAAIDTPPDEKKAKALTKAVCKLTKATAADLADPIWCQAQIARYISRMAGPNALPPLKVKQYTGAIADAHFHVTGRKLTEYAANLRDPLLLLNDGSLLDRTDAELSELRRAIDALDNLDLKKKSRWLQLIDQAQALKDKARTHPAAMMVYVCRTSEKGELFRLAQIHADFFNVWFDETYPNTLIMAPPGHGKTTCFRSMILWDIAHNTELRCLILYDTMDKAYKEVPVLKQYIRSPRYQALFPHVRLMGRLEGIESSKRRFTLDRPNKGSREPTIEGAGICTKINGSGYDRLYVDDPCPPEVVSQPGQREEIIARWDNETERRLRDPANSRIHIICTPWHPEDLAGHIIQQCQRKERTNWRIAVEQFIVHDDREGRPMSKWPNRFKATDYSGWRATMGRTKYNRLYKLQANPEESRKIQRLIYFPAEIDESSAAWHSYPREHQEAIQARIAAIMSSEQWLSIDPSATSGKQSSETATAHFALTSQGRAYVLDAYFFPGSPAEMQEWILAAITGVRPPEHPDWRLPHRVDRILIEGQGGIVGQVKLWIDTIERQLRDRNYDWNGFEIFKPRGMTTNQNVGKARRLIDCSGYLHNGLVRFAGRMILNGNRVEAVCTQRTDLAKLCNQILNFPVGTSDGVDAVTQFIIHNWSRIYDADSTKPSRGNSLVLMDELLTEKKNQLKKAFEATDETQSDMESQWIRELLYL